MFLAAPQVSAAHQPPGSVRWQARRRPDSIGAAAVDGTTSSLVEPSEEGAEADSLGCVVSEGEEPEGEEPEGEEVAAGQARP